MNLSELKKTAKERLQPHCRVCPVCDGRVCAGEMPGMGGTGSGASFAANISALARVKLNLRTIHQAAQPDISLTLFERKLEMPMMAAPIAGVRFNMGGYMTELDYTRTVLEGSKLAGTMGWTGDGPHPEIFAAAQDAIGESGGVAIVKPREDEVILEYFRKLEEARPVAVGVDVDGAGAITMALQGQPVGPKSPESLRKIVKASPWPFILKGIMTPDEAELAVEVGAAAIVVSNHGGRVLDHTPGTAEVLPGIAEKVKGKIAIIADGGVRSGVDVLKFLALGADAVLVGRPLVIGAYGGGAEGVAFVLRRMADELRQAMILTGCANLADIGPRVLAV